MDKKLTIEDVKKKKIELESNILKSINEFEDNCGVYCSYINIKRKVDDESKVVEAPDGPTKKGPVENVDVNMELDLIY